jgi:hypothetical protein
MSVASGSVDDATGNGKNASAPYARGSHAESIQYQRLQTDLRRVSDESAQLKKELQVERYARINAERRQNLQALQMDGYALDPDKEMERLNAGKVNSEQFTDAVAAITEHYQRMPTLDLPYDPIAGMIEPTAPGNRLQKEQYGKACADKARVICEGIIAEGKDADYVAVLTDVKNGKYGDVA